MHLLLHIKTIKRKLTDKLKTVFIFIQMTFIIIIYAKLSTYKSIYIYICFYSLFSTMERKKMFVKPLIASIKLLYVDFYWQVNDD